VLIKGVFLDFATHVDLQYLLLCLGSRSWNIHLKAGT